MCHRQARAPQYYEKVKWLLSVLSRFKSIKSPTVGNHRMNGLEELVSILQQTLSPDQAISSSKSSRLEFSHPSGRTRFRRPLAGNAHRTPSCRRSSSCPAGGPIGVWGGSEKKRNNLLFLHFSYIFVSKQVRRQAGLQLRRLLTNQQVWHQLGNLRAEVAGHVYMF